MAGWDASQSKVFNARPFYQYSITQVLCNLETGGQGSPHSDCQPHSTNVSSHKLWSGDEGNTRGTERRLDNVVGHPGHTVWMGVWSFRGFLLERSAHVLSFSEVLLICPWRGFQRRRAFRETLGVQEWLFIICRHPKVWLGHGQWMNAEVLNLLALPLSPFPFSCCQPLNLNT